jgi:hypothetical protein
MIFKFLRSPWIVSTVVLLVLGYPLWEVFDRNSPVVRFQGDIDPMVVAPGDTLHIAWYITSSRTCSGTVRRQIIDSHGIIHDYSAVPAVAQEGEQELLRDVKLPTVLPEGPATYQAFLTFYCNPMHWFWPIHEATLPLKFIVKNRETP